LFQMKSLSDDEVLELTWHFMEVAQAGQHREIFSDPAQQRWLIYLAKQGLVEVSDERVGLAVTSLTVKGDRLLFEFNSLRLWKRHVGPFILCGGDIGYADIDGQRWHNVVLRCLYNAWLWMLRRVGLD